LPGRLWRILSAAAPVGPRPAPLDLPALPGPLPVGKPLVLALLPWLKVGGAERVVLDVIAGSSGELSFAILPASGEGPVDPAVRDATPWIFPPAADDYARSLARILTENSVRSLLISSCPQAYAALPALGDRAPEVFSILHNTAPEGSLGAAVACDRWIRRHIAVGELQAEALRREGIAPEKITVAPNGVDCHGRFRPPAPPAANEGALLLGWVGRLSEEKDPALFLYTLAKLPEAKGLLLGDGPERFRLERLIRELGLDQRVRITGFTSHVAERLAACDALVLTSRTEGSPLTILEAMSLEKPVIAADVGAVREAVEDGVTGFLVRERTPEAFAAAIQRLAIDPRLRRDLGANARLRVVDRFSIERMLGVYRRELLP
jgi:glycosyltransferase involved in cell wall biosynthesis